MPVWRSLPDRMFAERDGAGFGCEQSPALRPNAHQIAYLSEQDGTPALPQPSNTCEMPEVAAMRYIEQLRSNYGTVTILPDNEDAETRDMQMAIDCCGEWTNWSDQRFYGETVIQCLARAVVILEKWKDMNNVG